MIDNIARMLAAALRQIADAPDMHELERLRVRYIGRKGELTSVLRGLKNLVVDERVKIGGVANEARVQLFSALTRAENRLSSKKLKPIDITLPGIKPKVGHLHLVSEAIQEITEIFKEIGFQRIRHPEIESDWYAFEALNMPINHPARDEWETFFMDYPKKRNERYVLTPHATSGTARALVEEEVPIRVINIQKVYRRQSDASHLIMHHQFDGLYVDKNVTIQHLKGVFEYFVKAFFGEGREIRFRPFHFRFTEPSFEIDITCAVCNGKGCKLCHQGWTELGGSGMVHPNVLKVANLDPSKVSGFAFGWGVERNLLMRAGLDIPDIRVLYENDLRFLEQF